MNTVSWKDLVLASMDYGILTTIDSQVTASRSKKMNNKARYLVESYVKEQLVDCHCHVPADIINICAVIVSPPSSISNENETELRNNLEKWAKGTQSEHPPSQSLSISNIYRLLQSEVYEGHIAMIQDEIREPIMKLIAKMATQKDYNEDITLLHQCLSIYKAIMCSSSESSSWEMIFSLVETSKSLLIKKQAIEILLIIMDASANPNTALLIRAQIMAQLPSMRNFNEEEKFFGNDAPKMSKDKFMAFVDCVFGYLADMKIPSTTPIVPTHAHCTIGGQNDAM